MKKREKSKLMKFLDYITSKAFRETVKNIFIALIIIGIIVLGYFYFIDYSAKKVKERTGVDVLKGIGSEHQTIDLGLSEVSAEAFVINGKLKTRITFDTAEKTYAFAKLSGRGRVINETSDKAKNEHEFVFEMMEDDFGSLFVYTIIVTDGFGSEDKIMGKITMSEKSPVKNQTGAKVTFG